MKLFKKGEERPTYPPIHHCQPSSIMQLILSDYSTVRQAMRLARASSPKEIK